MICTITTMAAYLYCRSLDDIPLTQERTAATLALTGVALLVLARTSRPFVPWKVALVASMAGLVIAAIITPLGRSFFELDLPPQRVMWAIAGMVAIAGWLLVLVAWVVRQLRPRRLTVRSRILVLAATNVVLAAGITVVLPLLPDLQEANGLTTAQLGMVAGVSFLAGLIGQLGLARFVDRGYTASPPRGVRR